MIKPSLPQGTRDFGPEIVRKRQYIFHSIQSVFESYGFQPLETPAMENLETLMGKYGEEGDKLIFKILNNGLNDPKNMDKARLAFEQVLQGRNDKNLTERALRYDLTIPFARYVAMNHGQLHFPFKRYQIQPVWRADRPQKGRYREFYQCDADIVGSRSLLNEVELAILYATVFRKLGIEVDIKINSRKILNALAESCGGPELMIPIATAIDKLDKIGPDRVKEELRQKGLSPRHLDLVEKYLSITGTHRTVFPALQSLLGHLESGRKGIEEMEFLLNRTVPYTDQISPDLTLARGLNYYTGIIFEVKAKKVQMGSIGGGGRYDDLTGLLGLPGIPGVGISFGVDRIYDVMEELGLFPAEVHKGTQVLFFNMGDAESVQAFQYVQLLREKGIATELYDEPVKFDKQFKYATKNEIPFAAIIGNQELETGTLVIKDLRSGEQQTIQAGQLASFDFS